MSAKPAVAEDARVVRFYRCRWCSGVFDKVESFSYEFYVAFLKSAKDVRETATHICNGSTDLVGIGDLVGCRPMRDYEMKDL